MTLLTDLFKKKQQCVEAVQVAAEAQAILNSPLVQEFFTKAEASMMAQWKTTPDDAVDARERLYALIKILGNFKAHFDGYVINGKFAEYELEAIVKAEQEKR